MLHECGLLIEVLECAQQGREGLLSGALVDEDLLYLLLEVKGIVFFETVNHLNVIFDFAVVVVVDVVSDVDLGVSIL